MKFSEIMRGHVPVGSDQIKAIWAKAHFCFDTNVLLDIYRYSDANRRSFLSLLNAIKGRIFVPHQVALEFARNRSTVIYDHASPQRIIKAKLDDARKEIEEKHKKHTDLTTLIMLIDSMKQLWQEKFDSAENRIDSLLKDDSLLAELFDAIGDEAGEPISAEDAELEFKNRKETQRPPYCKDDDNAKSSNPEGGRGDVVIWMELLKKYEGTGTPLIFVTGDMKTNWWQELKGRKTPQPALVREAYSRTEAEILFYSSEHFSSSAPGRLGVSITPGFAEETRQIRRQESIRRRGEERLRRARHILQVNARASGKPQTISSALAESQSVTKDKEDRINLDALLSDPNMIPPSLKALFAKLGSQTDSAIAPSLQAIIRDSLQTHENE